MHSKEKGDTKMLELLHYSASLNWTIKSAFAKPYIVFKVTYIIDRETNGPKKQLTIGIKFCVTNITSV